MEENFHAQKIVTDISVGSPAVHAQINTSRMLLVVQVITIPFEFHPSQYYWDSAEYTSKRSAVGGVVPTGVYIVG